MKLVKKLTNRKLEIQNRLKNGIEMELPILKKKIQEEAFKCRSMVVDNLKLFNVKCLLQAV